MTFRMAEISLLQKPYEKVVETTRDYYKIIFKTEPKNACAIFDVCLQRMAGISIDETEMQSAIANLEMAVRHYQEDAQLRTQAFDDIFNDLMGPLPQRMTSLKRDDDEAAAGDVSKTNTAMPTLTDLCRRRRLSDAGSLNGSDVEVGLEGEDMSGEEVGPEDEVKSVDEAARTTSRKRRPALGSDITVHTTRRRRRRIVKG